MNAAKRYEIFSRFREDNPKPETELNYSSPFELLIAVILSAQATDVGVNKATDKLFPVANTPEAIYALGYDGLCEYVKTIGLYPTKAKNVIETCRLLIERHNSQVPRRAQSSKPCPEWVVKRLTSFSILLLGKSRWQSTRIFSVLAIAPISRLARTF